MIDLQVETALHVGRVGDEIRADSCGVKERSAICRRLAVDYDHAGRVAGRSEEHGVGFFACEFHTVLVGLEALSVHEDGDLLGQAVEGYALLRGTRANQQRCRQQDESAQTPREALTGHPWISSVQRLADARGMQDVSVADDM